MSSRNFILIIISIQFLIISYLIFKISEKFPAILGDSAIIIPQNKEDFSYPPTDKLQFFYEPKPNSIRKDKVPNSLEEITYSFNSESLNEDKEYSSEKEPDTFRIISLGDSYTFGLYVNPSNNYSKKLERLLSQDQLCNKQKRYEVINLGVPGYDIQYTVERFKLRGQKLNPDLVIWLLKADDFFQINEFIELRSREIHQQLLDSGEQQVLENQGKFYEHKVRATKELLSNMSLETILGMQANQLREIEKYYNGKLLIFAIPYDRTAIEAVLDEFANSRNQTHYFRDFPSFSPSEHLLADGHPNAKGHDYIAQNLLNYLKKEQILCN